jgi:putative transposase
MDPERRKKMRRFERTHDVRFLTFSTYQRLPLFKNDRIKDRFVQHLVAARTRHRFHLYGWVIMPEHVHLLLWPCLPAYPVAAALHALKRAFAQEVIARWRLRGAKVLEQLLAPDGSTRFWQRGGGYDRNIFTGEEFEEKLRYIHNNPVIRGLVSRPEEWAWSSARWYLGMKEGTLAMDPIPPRRPTE